MTQATTSIDPRLIGMLGRKLYSSNPLPILTRELLQNSEDACKRKGVDPRITITIAQLHGRGTETWVVSCTDNGIGMTADEIVNDFLCLGGKKADGTGQTGGFGIAKAAIMGCEDWMVWSLDNYLDRNILENGKKIEKRRMREGTRVTAIVEADVYISTLEKALQMIYFSDTSVRVSVFSAGYPIISFQDSNAGLPAETKRRMLEENDMFDLWGTTELALSDERKYAGLQKSGWTVIRLNGLVQYIPDHRNEVRENNLVFDIKTDADPEDDTYPFSMSREELIDEYFTAVQLLRKAHDANVIESAVSVREDQPSHETVSVIKGKLLSGGRSTRYTTRKSGSRGMGNKTTTKLTVEEKINKIKSSSGLAQLLISQYERDPDTRVWHSKILLAWQDVLQVAAEDGEEFGIGITSSSFIGASRRHVDGVIYYVLSPERIMKNEISKQSPEAIVLFLWTLACHEVTHRYISDHNEWFTTTENNIQRDSSEVILRLLPKIAGRLK